MGSQRYRHAEFRKIQLPSELIMWRNAHFAQYWVPRYANNLIFSCSLFLPWLLWDTKAKADLPLYIISRNESKSACLQSYNVPYYRISSLQMITTLKGTRSPSMYDAKISLLGNSKRFIEKENMNYLIYITARIAHVSSPWSNAALSKESLITV